MAEELKGKVIGALAYPVILAIVGTIVVNVLVIFFVPKFESMFKKLEENGELPSLTSGIMWLSHVMQNFWWLILALMAGAFFAFRTWVRTENGRLQMDRFRLRAPLFGKLYLSLSLSRFTQATARVPRATSRCGAGFTLRKTNE